MGNKSTPNSFDAVNQSSFRFYSWGIVAQNKELNSNYIEVSPVEDMLNLDGELTDHVYQYKSQGRDFRGNAYQTEVNTTATIKAKWLALSQSNRMTAPDVRRGEKVAIYRMANSDHFFWDTAVNDSNTRRLETAVFAYSGTKKEDEPLSDKNSYTQGVSTHNKLVNLIHTSQANGEKFGYDVNVDTDKSVVTIKDNVGNRIILDSSQTLIHIINQRGSEVKLDKGQITIKAPESITIDAPKIQITGEINHTGKQTSSGGYQTTAEVQAKHIKLTTHRHDRTGPPVG